MFQKSLSANNYGGAGSGCLPTAVSFKGIMLRFVNYLMFFIGKPIKLVKDKRRSKMSISAISSSVSSLQASQTDSFARVKQDFDSLGSALKSGDLSKAKEAFAQLQKDVSSQSGKSNNPLSSDMESLGNALESGDLKAAQTAYENIQAKVSQVLPAGGGGGTSRPSGSGNTSQSSSQTYDKRDTNKDGVVTVVEQLEYDLKHPSEANGSQQVKESSNDSDIDVGRNLNTLA
jgi:hypothetical protein